MIVDPLNTYTREQVVANIKKAAASGPVAFDFLLKQAEIESGLNPNAKASTSSAAGPFQFVNGTWLKMVEKHGESVGLSSEAAALRENRVDQTVRAEILAKRSDVTLSAKMAARLAVDNAQALSAAGHKNIGPAELYLAHFLGAAGAADFLSGMRTNPNAPAADAVPAAARSNANVFYANGAPRSFTEIYNRFAQKFNGVAAPLGGDAVAGVPQPQQDAAQVQSLENVEAGKGVPDEFDAIAKETLADARMTKNVAQRERMERAQDMKGQTEQVAETVAEVTEAALANYLAGFSKGFEDPSKGILDPAQAETRDASRGATDEIHSIASAAMTAVPGNVGLGMKIILNAASGSAEKPREFRADEAASVSAASTPPAVRQAVQWVSLFSDPRGADSIPPGRA